MIFRSGDPVALTCDQVFAERRTGKALHDLFGGGVARPAGGRSILPIPFHREESEKFVFYKRPANRAAELLPVKRGFLSSAKRAFGLKRVVPEKKKRAAVPVVRSRLGDDI